MAQVLLQEIRSRSSHAHRLPFERFAHPLRRPSIAGRMPILGIAPRNRFCEAFTFKSLVVAMVICPLLGEHHCTPKKRFCTRVYLRFWNKVGGQPAAPFGVTEGDAEEG